jgi:hypothetical protein
MDTFELDIAETDFTQTKLYSAVTSGKSHYVLKALHHGENIYTRDPEFNTTYLHLVINTADSASEDKLAACVYQLSNAGIEIDAVNYKGETALELAIKRELPHLVGALIRVGASMTVKGYQKIIRSLRGPRRQEVHDVFDKYEPGLWVAVEQGNCGIVQLLVNSWCRINITRNGETLMDVARCSDHRQELVSILDDFQVTVEFVHATLAGDEQRMLEFLMDSKPCDPYIMDISHQDTWSSPLSPKSLRDTAISLGHSHILHLLPEDNLNIDKDVKGYLGGVTLATTSKLLTSPDQTNRNDKQRCSSQSSSNGVTSIGKIKTVQPSKLKPMKAKIPYPIEKFTDSQTSQPPDVIAEHPMASKEARLLKLQLDLLNTSTPSEDDHCYEPSRLTGSVAVRSKSKSRKSLIGVYSVDDWTDSTQDPLNKSLDSHSMDHIATPRGKTTLKGLEYFNNSHDYSKNWKRSSVRSSSSHTKSRPKEIMSKMCVIS